MKTKWHWVLQQDKVPYGFSKIQMEVSWKNGNFVAETWVTGHVQETFRAWKLK